MTPPVLHGEDILYRYKCYKLIIDTKTRKNYTGLIRKREGCNMARETNAQLKKELEEARETVKDLMLKLAGMNKKANTAYEQSPLYKADQKQIDTLNKKCDQLQKSLDDAKLTIRQLEVNIEIMGANAEKNDSNKALLECQILKKDNAELHSERRNLIFENKKLKEDNGILKQKVEDLENSVNESHKNTIAVGKTMEESSEFYLKQIQELQEENRKLRSQTEPVHNARGAGRKKNDAAWIKKYVEFCSLVKNGKTMADIMGKMQISRSTYFRFMRSYKEDLELDTAIDTAQEEIRKKNKVSKNNK